MSAVEDILSQIPLDQLAGQLGVNEQEAEQATRTALPALLGGIQANTEDPGGAASFAQAVQQHDPALVEGGVDLNQVDPNDGQKIVSHVFGAQQDQVVQQLGGVGGVRLGADPEAAADPRADRDGLPRQAAHRRHVERRGRTAASAACWAACSAGCWAAVRRRRSSGSSRAGPTSARSSAACWAAAPARQTIAHRAAAGVALVAEHLGRPARPPRRRPG